jgi:hypothetical protein
MEGVRLPKAGNWNAIYDYFLNDENISLLMNVNLTNFIQPINVCVDGVSYNEAEIIASIRSLNRRRAAEAARKRRSRESKID